MFIIFVVATILIYIGILTILVKLRPQSVGVLKERVSWNMWKDVFVGLQGDLYYELLIYWLAPLFLSIVIVTILSKIILQATL